MGPASLSTLRRNTSCVMKIKFFGNCTLFQPCPMWSLWLNWNACSAPCNSGVRSRRRVCLNGDSGQAGCDGQMDSFEVCNDQVSNYFCSTFVCCICILLTIHTRVFALLFFYLLTLFYLRVFISFQLVC